MKFVGEGGADTVTLVAAELSAGFGSTAEELATSAVLLMVEVFSSELRVVPTSVTVPDCPLAREANVMVRFRPWPLSHVPPGPAVQERKVMLALSSRSLTATEAVAGPLLVTVMLYVS